MGGYQWRLFSAISEHSSIRGTPDDIEAWLMSSVPVSHANRSHVLVGARGRTISATCGLSCEMSFARFDRRSSGWRTSPHYDALDGKRVTRRRRKPVTSGEWRATWPRAGIVLGGTAYPLPPSAPITRGTGYGLWPTMLKNDAQQKLYTYDRGDHGTPRPTLLAYLRAGGRLPTPCNPRCGSNRSAGAGAALRPSIYTLLRMASETGGNANPEWIEWFMGWPIGWTDVGRLVKDRFRQWCEAHGISSPEE